MSRQQAYELLKHAGHSPEKALEIAIDYERGDELARRWVSGVAAGTLPVKLKE